MIAIDTCPRCGASGEYTFREWGKRVTTQPLTFMLAANGALREDGYAEFDYGDDVEVEGFSCGSCGHKWESTEHLQADMTVWALANALADVRTVLDEQTIPIRVRDVPRGCTVNDTAIAAIDEALALARKQLGREAE